VCIGSIFFFIIIIISEAINTGTVGRPAVLCVCAQLYLYTLYAHGSYITILLLSYYYNTRYDIESDVPDRTYDIFLFLYGGAFVHLFIVHIYYNTRVYTIISCVHAKPRNPISTDPLIFFTHTHKHDNIQCPRYNMYLFGTRTVRVYTKAMHSAALIVV